MGAGDGGAAAGGEKARVLLVGSCGGQAAALRKKLAALHRKKGPFACAVGVGGPFFGPGGANLQDLDAAPGAGPGEQMPLPVHFVGAYGEGGEAGLEWLQAQAAGPGANVEHLGHHGVRKLPCGLQVAYLEGTYRGGGGTREAGSGVPHAAPSEFYNDADVEDLIRLAGEASGDIDLLLTTDWPAGVALGSAGAPAGAPHGEPAVAKLAEALRPRYHLASSPASPSWTRSPYVNADLGAGSHVTRFIALSHVGNADKEKGKWLHALALTPASLMTPEELQAKPSDTTPSPYGLAKQQQGNGRKRGPPEEGGNWRYDLSKVPRADHQSGVRSNVIRDNRKTIFVKNLPYDAAREDLEKFFLSCGDIVDLRHGRTNDRPNGYAHIQFDDVLAVEEACKLNGEELMGRKLFVCPAEQGANDRKGPTSVQSCWFCLSNPNFDERLVVSVGEHTYLAMDKGAITPSHTLIIPIEHLPSTLVLPEAAFAEVHKYLGCIQRCCAANGEAFVWFERYLALKRKEGGNHCHVNAIGFPEAHADQLEAVFQKKAKDQGFEFDVFEPDAGKDLQDQLRDRVGDMEFLIVGLPDGKYLVHPIMRGERMPMNFGREAVAEAIEQAERGDWKNCKMSEEDELKLTEKFKGTFSEFDPAS